MGISDCHKIVTTCLRVNLPRLRNKNIIYRSFKNFDKETFLKKLKEAMSTCVFTMDTNKSYDIIVNTIVMLLDTYAPLKKKILRGNQSRFMNKELSKAIMKRSALKSKYHKHPNSTNRALFKKKKKYMRFSEKKGHKK